ncbi:MAG TPA: hypothetical protein P5230_02760 [Candidatus Magasanikbacteria bacterium]|nr:hypothetical protein [Candidatus Magasanikbacteria bacterium]
MFNKVFKDLFRLLRQTDGRGVLADGENGDLYVILPASEYEKLTSGTHHQIANLNEDEMLEKVNKEIAFWHSLQEEKKKYEEFEEILRKNKEKKSINRALEQLINEDRKNNQPEINFSRTERKNNLGPGLVSLKDVLTSQDVVSRRRDVKKEDFEQKLRKKNDPDQEFYNNGFFGEENLNDIPEEEERFYLEPVE